MNTKLTLNINKSVIEKAKNYARMENISLSRLIESYLSSLTDKRIGKDEITPLVDSLSGIIKLEDDFNYRDAYTDHLIEKHK